MNRLIFGCVAVPALVRTARLRACVAAFALLALALVAMPALAITDTWAPGGRLNAPRSGHAATLLSSGKVLVTGGGGSPASAELFDPATDTSSAAGSMASARVGYAATLLSSGKVLVTGGYNGGILASTELYDPATNTWSAASPMASVRYYHTATLLPSGKVLVAGGLANSGAAGAELYDPATDTWSAAGNMAKARYLHAATLLPSGKVLVVGGAGAGVVTELYDPATNAWSATGSLGTARYSAAATSLPSGQVLVVGGYRLGNIVLASAESYDPATGTWSAAGAMVSARVNQTMTLLPSGRVLVAGGFMGSGASLASAEIYDPATNAWRVAGTMVSARQGHTATLLPSGRLLVAGGSNSDGTLVSTERYDPAAGAWSTATAMAAARVNQTMTLLPSGQVLAVGGNGSSNAPATATAERYDPATNAWSAAASLANPRQSHTATLLPSGRVLVVGGYVAGNSLASAELYDPATNAWSAAGSLAMARYRHTATLLASGKVLVVGGYDGNGDLASAESYDPATNTWSAAGSLAEARSAHAATLLASGKALVTGGHNGSGDLASAELYDPMTNTWSATGYLAVARQGHAASLLPSGKVLVAGGSRSGGAAYASTELYDPATGMWSTAGVLAAARNGPTATLLPSGQVLVAGGYDGNLVVGNYLASAERYDPVTNAWSAAGSMASTRGLHTATLLLSGKVLVAGGYATNATALASAELYDAGLAPVAALQPDLGTVSAFLSQAGTLVATSAGSATFANAATATGFMPRREGSSNSYGNSASNMPVFQLQRIDNDQTRFVPNDGSVAMTDTTFSGSSSALAGFPAGPVRVRVWVNGVPSAARHSILAATPGRPAAPSAAGDVMQATVDFAAATETGGAPITSYTATASPGGATAGCTAPCTSIVFSPLAPGDYTFTVHATNVAGNGPESPASNAATVMAPSSPLLDWPAPDAIVYGVALDATQLNATATYNGNPLPGTFAYAPPVGSVLPAGNARTLSVTFTPSDTVHYASATASVLIDVTPAPLSVAGTSVQNKSYDGTTTATLTSGTLVGVLATDAGEVILTEAGTFAQANVGAVIAVTANDAIIGGAAANYTLTQPTGLHAGITPATLTYTATPLTMPYGTTPSGLGGTVTGFVPGESQATATTGTPSFTTTATASSGPGQYLIIGSGLSANAGNYVFVQAAANFAALTIERAEQAALSLVATPDVLIPGMDSQLAASGGSGSGGVGYGVDSGPCSLGGSGVTATGAGNCVVRATKAADANYNAASATATITVQTASPPLAQAQSASAFLNTARTIQLVGSDGNVGGPYALTYAIADAPAHGTIEGLDASAGTLTYTPQVDYIGPDAFTFTVASAHGVSQAATVGVSVTAPPLALLVGDGRDYARYGQVVDYVATLTNAGTAMDALPVTFTLSDGFDRDSLRLDCFVPGGDAECSRDANDPLRYTITLQPGRTLTWLASVQVRPDAAQGTVSFGVASAAGNLADTNTLVLLRDGFDVAGSDGTQATRVVEGEQAKAILDADGLIDVVVPASIGVAPASLMIVRDAAHEVRIETRLVAGTLLVRLFERSADGGGRVSAWCATRPGAVLTLGSTAQDAAPAAYARWPRALLLVGAEQSIALP